MSRDDVSLRQHGAELEAARVRLLHGSRDEGPAEYDGSQRRLQRLPNAEERAHRTGDTEPSQDTKMLTHLTNLLTYIL